MLLQCLSCSFGQKINIVDIIMTMTMTTTKKNKIQNRSLNLQKYFLSSLLFLFVIFPITSSYSTFTFPLFTSSNCLCFFSIFFPIFPCHLFLHIFLKLKTFYQRFFEPFFKLKFRIFYSSLQLSKGISF